MKMKDLIVFFLLLIIIIISIVILFYIPLHYCCGRLHPKQSLEVLGFETLYGLDELWILTGL